MILNSWRASQRLCLILLRESTPYDFGDTAGTTPLMKMLTLGREYKNPPIHAGGLRYHAMAPIISYLIANGHMKSVAFGQKEVFEAGVTFARTEGIIPAPESAHEIRYVIDEALRCKKSGQAKNIVFNNSGHALLDLAAYEAYLAGSSKTGSRRKSSTRLS